MLIMVLFGQCIQNTYSHATLGALILFSMQLHYNCIITTVAASLKGDAS